MSFSDVWQGQLVLALAVELNVHKVSYINSIKCVIFFKA